MIPSGERGILFQKVSSFVSFSAAAESIKHTSAGFFTLGSLGLAAAGDAGVDILLL
jgi:hypothetical protein